MTSQARPDHPPYGGAFDTIVPHLTVVHAGEAEQQAAERDLVRLFAPGGGIRSRCADDDLGPVAVGSDGDRDVNLEVHEGVATA
jgi:hypothetical protein